MADVKTGLKIVDSKRLTMGEEIVQVNAAEMEDVNGRVVIVLVNAAATMVGASVGVLTKRIVELDPTMVDVMEAGSAGYKCLSNWTSIL